MAKEPTVITVAKIEKDEYGNLSVTDTLGNITRINKKHEKLHPLFEVGKAIKLTWAVYKNVDYVDDAELFNGKPPEEKQVEPITPSVEKPQIAPQAVGMITKEIGDHIRAGTLSTVFGTKIANSLLVWYRGQTLGITQINFDGKDLPKFK